MTEITNARIKSTFLGVEDHGCFTFILDLDYGGSGQGFGTFILDEPLKNGEKFVRRIGTAFGCDAIMQVLKVVGVDEWEKLPGKHIRVRRGDGWQGRIEAIGNIIADNWLDIAVLGEQHGINRGVPA